MSTKDKLSMHEKIQEHNNKLHRFDPIMYNTIIKNNSPRFPSGYINSEQEKYLCEKEEVYKLLSNCTPLQIELKKLIKERQIGWWCNKEGVKCKQCKNIVGPKCCIIKKYTLPTGEGENIGQKLEREYREQLFITREKRRILSESQGHQ